MSVTFIVGDKETTQHSFSSNFLTISFVDFLTTNIEKLYTLLLPCVSTRNLEGCAVKNRWLRTTRVNDLVGPDKKVSMSQVLSRYRTNVNYEIRSNEGEEEGTIYDVNTPFRI